MTSCAVSDALRWARKALSESHNLTVTDRPDLPRDQWPVWVTDHSAALSLIDQAEAELRGDLAAQLAANEEALQQVLEAQKRPMEASDIALAVHEFVRDCGFNAPPGLIAEGMFIAMQLVGGVTHAARVAGQFSRESRA